MWTSSTLLSIFCGERSSDSSKAARDTTDPPLLINCSSAHSVGGPAFIDQQLTLIKTPQIVLEIDGPLSLSMTESSFHSLAGLLRFTKDRTGWINGFGLSLIACAIFASTVFARRKIHEDNLESIFCFSAGLGIRGLGHSLRSRPPGKA
jgi:hypothetical protein